MARKTRRQSDNLPEMQELFCHEYIIDLNATQASIRAGYSKKGASVTGCRLLANVKVQEKIAVLMREREKATKITQERVVQELAKLAFYDIRDAIDWDADPGSVKLKPAGEIDPVTAAAITQVSTGMTGMKFKMADKRAALEALLRHTSGIQGDQDAPPLNITFNVSEPVGEIRVTKS